MNSIIIFDLDGTLIDSRADLALAVNLTRADYGLAPLPQATVVSYVGDGIRNLMKRSFQDAAFPWELDEIVAVDKRHYEAHLLDQTTAYPGVCETLAALKSSHKLAVVTNKPHAAAEAILSGLGILPHLDFLVGGDRVAHLKPDPEPLFLAMSATGSGPDGSWMVGDHRTDLGAAANAGVKGCFCAYGFGRRDGLHADAAITSFDQLTSVIQP